MSDAARREKFHRAYRCAMWVSAAVALGLLVCSAFAAAAGEKEGAFLTVVGALFCFYYATKFADDAARNAKNPSPAEAEEG